MIAKWEKLMNSHKEAKLCLDMNKNTEKMAGNRQTISSVN